MVRRKRTCLLRDAFILAHGSFEEDSRFGAAALCGRFSVKDRFLSGTRLAHSVSSTSIWPVKAPASFFFFFSSAFAVLMPFAAADLNAVECYLHARTLRSRREQNGTLDGCQYLLNFMGTDGYLLAPSN